MAIINKFTRYINQNIRNIIIVIIIILFVVSGIKLLNNIVKEKRENEQLKGPEKKVTYVEEKQSKAAISNEKIDKEKTTKNINVINEFINYCNSGKVEDAYALISDECKSIYYKTVEDFREYYYNQVFNTTKLVDLQAWINNKKGVTYKIELTEDFLSTGLYNQNEYIEEYYTIVKDDDKNTKININKFIDLENISRENTKNDITIKCVEKEIHKEYEIYKFIVTNNSDEDIMLDSLEDTDSVYLEGDNEVIYSAYMHELVEDDLIIGNGKTKEIKIKFNKFYNPDMNIEKVYFNDIVCNYNEYKTQKFKDNMQMQISIK